MPARSDGSSRVGESSGIPDVEGRSNIIARSSAAALRSGVWFQCNLDAKLYGTRRSRGRCLRTLALEVIEVLRTNVSIAQPPVSRRPAVGTDRPDRRSATLHDPHELTENGW